MSIINPNVKLSQLAITQVWAKLERLDKKGTYNFLVNPEEITWSHQAEFNTLSVLYTAQPLVSYKSSSSSLSIPKVYFWTPAHSGDLTKILAALKDMTKPPTPGQQPPVLKLTWGESVQPRLYLKSFGYREKQWRSGKVTSAEGSMEFILAPEPTKPQYNKIPVSSSSSSSSNSSGSSSSSSSSSSSKTATSTKLTDRERTKLAAKLLAKLNTDKALKVKYNYKSIDKVTVDADGVAEVHADKGFNIFTILKLSILGIK